jgi:hypothetical protein
MDKMMEFIDGLMKSQKEFMESWVNSQKQFIESLTGAAKTMQESLLNMGGTQEGTTKEMLNLYKSTLTTIVDSSKVLTDEAERIQETWKNAFAKQLDMSRDIVKNLSELFRKAA